jgi:hypothetical protein
MDGWEDEMIMKPKFPFRISNADITGGSIWEQGKASSNFGMENSVYRKLILTQFRLSYCPYKQNLELKEVRTNLALILVLNFNALLYYIVNMCLKKKIPPPRQITVTVYLN